MRFLFGGRVRFVALLAVAVAAMAALPAAARPPGTNGQITFARFSRGKDRGSGQTIPARRAGSACPSRLRTSSLPI